MSEEAPGPPPATRYDYAAWALAAVALLGVLELHLLPSLLAGLLIYEMVHVLAPRLRLGAMSDQRGKVLALGLLGAAAVAAVIVAASSLIAFVRSDAGSLPALLKRLADIVEGSRNLLPAAVLQRLPGNPDELKSVLVEWLRSHADALTHAGRETARALAHAIVGMVAGALVALEDSAGGAPSRPLAAALRERARRLGDAFRRIVFAQVQISALNTALTSVYLVILLPLLGVQLPLAKTLIVITFVAGLLPVIGNLISNTVIVIASLGVSPYVAAGSLVFLIVIHKLEYFANARIVGSQIQAKAWELLLAMLVLESVFGLPGVAAAPIYYAYLRDELSSRGLV